MILERRSSNVHRASRRAFTIGTGVVDEDRSPCCWLAAAEVELSGTLFDAVIIVDAVIAGDVNGVASFSTKWTCCMSLELKEIKLVTMHSV